MGSIRTLQRGKKADAHRQQLESILRRSKNEIADLFAVHGFKVRGDWFQVDGHNELVFDDTRMGAGGVRVFRRNSCGRFFGIHFRGAENPDKDRGVYTEVQEQVALFEKKLSPADFEHPLLSNAVFMDLDCFLDNSPKWIEEMMIPCPECGGTGKTTLDGKTSDCCVCEGCGEIERDSLL
jgi:hypothetical protein